MDPDDKLSMVQDLITAHELIAKCAATLLEDLCENDLTDTQREECEPQINILKQFIADHKGD